ncbi:MAG: TPM domain-containing protein [Flavobacterium sp.]
MTFLKNALSIFFLCLTLCSCAQKENTKNTAGDYRSEFWENPPKPRGYVNDFDTIYDERQKKELNELISQFESETSIEIALVTLDTLCTSKEKFDDLTLHLANVWGVGKKGKDNGILVGISKDYRKMRIQNGNGIEQLISDKETKKIIDDYFIPGFRKGDYFEGSREGLKRLIQLLKSKL